MAALADGWESDYDGTRWFYRYKATGTIQYHFPQPGDEFAEFLLDAGTGPLQLTPEERFAIDQAKQHNLSGSDSNTENGTETNGKKKTDATEGTHMTATGYFDPSSFMYFPGASQDANSVLGSGDGGNTANEASENTGDVVPGVAPEPAPLTKIDAIFNQPMGHAELPEDGQQMWSPIGNIAELATQETDKCAEELAPVELDATSFIPAPIHSNMLEQPAELPTHHSPVEQTPDPHYTQPVMQPVDSYPLTFASFAYPPLKANMQFVNEVLPSTVSDQPASQSTNEQSIPESATHTQDLTSGHSKLSHGSEPDRINQQIQISPVKQHSPNTSEVFSSASEPQGSSLSSSNQAEAIPGKLTSQGTFAPNSKPSQTPNHTVPGDSNKPEPSLINEGADGRLEIASAAKPQQINGQSSSTTVSVQYPNTVHQMPEKVSSTAINMPKPTSISPLTGSNAVTPADNTTIATTQSMDPTHLTQQQSSSVQGLLPSQNGSQNSGQGKVSLSPVTQANASSTLPPASSISYINQAHQLETHYNPNQNTHNHAQQQQHQTQKPTLSSSHVDGSGRIPGTAPVQHQLHQPQGPGNPPPQQAPGSSKIPKPQPVAQRPNFPHAAARPPLGYQGPTPTSAPGQAPQQSPNQLPSPVLTQSVSPLQSLVSSPATSIASLHASKPSTPSSTFASINAPTGSNIRPNINVNQTAMAAVRPSSVPAQNATQQIGNNKPPATSHPLVSSSTGMVQVQPSSTANPPAKPYPMLPGQVTPLPSQMGPTSAQQPPQQLTHNNQAKPTVNAQQQGVGLYPTQITPGNVAQYHALTGQMNLIPNSPGNVSSVKPPQPQTFSIPPGTNQISSQQYAVNPIQQPSVSSPQPVAYSQPQLPQTILSSTGANVPIIGQNSFPLPPTGQPPPSTQPFTSAQATAALADAGKGVKKWAKNLLKSPAIKQTTAVIGGAVMAETMGINPATGAQLANSIYANSNRPQLTHAQTAPVQAASQQQPVQTNQYAQMNQHNHLVKPQPGHPQSTYQPGHQISGSLQLGNPQSGYLQSGAPKPGHPQPGHPPPGNLQPGRPQSGSLPSGNPQPGHSQPGNPQPGHQQSGPLQPGNPQAGRPQSGYLQSGHPQLGRPQQGSPQPGQPRPSQPQSGYVQPALGRPQLVQPQQVGQPIGMQPQGRPPVAYSITPAAGVAVNFNPQAQAQIRVNQQQQYPLANPPIMGNRPPPTTMSIGTPGIQAQAQPNVDANISATAAIIGSAIGAALRPQQAQPGMQGHAQPGHALSSESHDVGNHGYASENHNVAHEQTFDSYIPPPPPFPPPPATYTDNSYMATNVAYNEESNYFVNNTEAVDNTMYADNSTTAVEDTTYNNASYESMSYAETDVTMNMSVDVDVNLTLVSDGDAAIFNMDESMSVFSGGDFTAVSTDYSGDSWGGFE